ncbi:MAG TPA: hypothetical protein VJQ44_00120 [Gemmatimonadales bacterium]|nr:hypothetical protein [Gemmatimonadales bacterium]
MFVSVLLAAALGSGAAVTPPDPTVTLAVDSSRKEVVITAGPFDLPNMPPMENEQMMDFGMAHDTPIQQFDWPMDAWFRGFRLQMVDAEGRPVARSVLHHMIMVNFSRRMLLYEGPERLLGAGTETDDIVVPKSIGVPLKTGMRLGMYVAWHNSTGKDLPGVYLKLTMLWTPKNQNPPPVNAMPIYMDVNLTVGGHNTFDVPPGKSEKAHEFTMPVSGRLLGVGGHLHDYGVSVRLEDAESGKVLAMVKATRDPNGKLLKVGRKLFGVTGDGLKLKANHRYRVVGDYDNPTNVTEKRGAMAHMSGIFAPDDMSKWPAIDPRNPDYQRDMASLEVRGTDEPASEAHREHGDH